MTKGLTVVVKRGIKVPHGTTGVVFWVGTGDYGERLGFKDAAGTTFWTASKNVDVVGQPPTPAVLTDVVGLATDVDARFAALEARVAKLEAALGLVDEAA